jgi:UDP-GlcNAc:undecaprenyl-phosphate GlcNAc-1-phosphate transferase
MNVFIMMLVLLLIGGIPVVDTLVAMLRRAARLKSPFYPDRGHAHHILLDLKLRTWQVLCVLITAHAILVGSGYYILDSLR